MTREALKKLNEKQMNYCKTLSALIDRAKIKGLKEENERNRGKLRGFLECMEQMELLSGYEVKHYIYGSYLEIEENNRRQQSPPVPLVQLVRAAAS